MVGEELAKKLLASWSGLRLPVGMENLRDFCRAAGCELMSVSEAAELLRVCGLKSVGGDGMLLTAGKRRVILYRDDLIYGRKLFAIAHELGHVVLSHTGAPSNPAPCQEREADSFALYLLAPVCVLAAMGVNSEEEIRHFTLLEHQASQILRNLCAYRPSPSDRGVLKCFREFIRRNKRRKFCCWGKILAVPLALLLAASVIFGFPAERAGLREGPLVQPVWREREDAGQAFTVYVTRYGDRFHLEGCGHIAGREKFALSLERAKKIGYLPCRDCFGAPEG